MTLLTLSEPHALINSSPRIAVLTNNGTGSSGEVVTIAFRGRPETRSFGTPTCGLTSFNEGFPLGDRSVLFLAVALDADRGASYDGPIVPDEAISGDAATVTRAVQWLKGL